MEPEFSLVEFARELDAISQDNVDAVFTEHGITAPGVAHRQKQLCVMYLRQQRIIKSVATAILASKDTAAVLAEQGDALELAQRKILLPSVRSGYRMCMDDTRILD